MQTEEIIGKKCESCATLLAQNRQLNHKIIDLEDKKKQLQHAVETLESGKALIYPVNLIWKYM